jgi:hypothetical protein
LVPEKRSLEIEENNSKKVFFGIFQIPKKIFWRIMKWRMEKISNIKNIKNGENVIEWEKYLNLLFQ